MEEKQAFEYFNLLEQQFWKNLDKKTIDYITFNGDLNPKDMFLYGEFGFTLLGLKPAMLIEFRDEKINQLYLETVIQPILFTLKQKHLNYHVVKNIKTPESNLDGCIFLYDTRVSHQKLDSVLNNSITTLSEDTMADILDYPGHLPNSKEEISSMLTVIYFHDKSTTNNQDLIALTCFAIQTNEREKTMQHFKKYHQQCKDMYQINLKIYIK